MLVDVSEAANADLDGILDYGTARFGEDVSEAYIRRFEQVYDLIADHLLIGTLHRTVRPPDPQPALWQSPGVLRCFGRSRDGCGVSCTRARAASRSTGTGTVSMRFGGGRSGMA